MLSSRRNRRPWRVPLVGAGLLALVLGATLWIQTRDRFVEPSSRMVHRVAWTLGFPERLYNFGVVIPGHAYRSGLPDERFIRYVHERYGIRRVVSLNGPRPFHATARELGMRVDVLYWQPYKMPPDYELRFVLDALEGDEPVLVHCTGGRDRAGYAVASFRIRRQDWPARKALEELLRYGHDPQENPWIDTLLAFIGS